jgi:hypothetical protein
MLRQLGFPDSYVVAYNSAKGLHTTPVAYDPDTGALHKINYGNRVTVYGLEGGAALLQSHFRDISLNYRIFLPEGDMVKDVPSEMGKFLAVGSPHSMVGRV